MVFGKDIVNKKFQERLHKFPRGSTCTAIREVGPILPSKV